MTNRNNWIYWFLAVALAVALSANSAEDEPISGTEDQVPRTQDPIGDAFVAIHERTNPDAIHYWPPKLYIAPIDLNHDGRKDLLVTANYHRNGRQGQMWHVYINSDAGFAPVKGPVVLSSRSAVFRPAPETQSTYFYDLGTGGGGNATLMETRITETAIERRLVARMHDEDEEDLARMQSLKYVGQPLRAHVRYMDWGPLEKRYVARLHREPFERERNSISINNRSSASTGLFFDSVEEVYTWMPDEAREPKVSGPLSRVVDFADVEQALDFVRDRLILEGEAVLAKKLIQQFGETPLIERLEADLMRLEDQERYWTRSILAEIVRRSADSAVRQRFVQEVLTEGWFAGYSGYDWLASFRRADFNDASKAFLLEELNRTKDTAGTYYFRGRMARLAGIAGVKEAIPVLREINLAQREEENGTDNPLHRRSALLALARLGDADAVREMIALVEGAEPDDRAYSFQRLAILREPEVVQYLKRYLFSDAVHDGWRPIHDARRAAKALVVMLQGFPDAPDATVKEQRAWMDDQTEFEFNPLGPPVP